VASHATLYHIFGKKVIYLAEYHQFIPRLSRPPTNVIYKVDPNSEVGKKYNALGGASYFGPPTSNEYLNNQYRYQFFQRGAIFWTASVGACAMHDDIYFKYLSIGMDHSGIGYLLTDEISNEYGLGTHCRFENGIVYHRPRVGTFVVYRETLMKWEREGFEHGLGYPVSDTTTAADGEGTFTHFVHDRSIYWHPRTGAHLIDEPMRSNWSGRGGVQSLFGYPVTDTLVVGKNRDGRAVHFEGGGIFWHKNTGVREVHGDIFSLYQKMNGPDSALGFPITDEGEGEGLVERYNDFEGGIIVWSRDKGAAVLTSLKIVARQARAWYEDPGWLGGNPDPYYVVVVDRRQTRFPNRGDYSETPSGQWVILDASGAALLKLIKPLHHDTVVDIDRIMLHDANINGDDFMANSSPMRFAMDTAWQMQDIKARDRQIIVTGAGRGYFELHMNVQFPELFDERPEVFRRYQFWNFANPTGPQKLQWIDFKMAYPDTANEDLWYHPFDKLFFNTILEGICAGGNCFGMCLMSVYCRKDLNIYSNPIYRYSKNYVAPHSPYPLLREINWKHTFQAGHAVVQWFLYLFKRGQTHEPNNAFDLAKQLYERGNFPVICITSGWWDIQGHVLLPYKFVDGPDFRVIYVADPNKPYSPGGVYDSNETGKIIIDRRSNYWSYEMLSSSGTTTWSGSGGIVGSGGRIYPIPFGVLSTPPVNPLGLGQIFSDVLLLLFGSGTAATQIVDSNGRKFYKAEGRHVKEADVDLAPASGMVNAMRYISFDSAEARRVYGPGDVGAPPRPVSKDPEVYFVGRAQGASYEIKLRGLANQQCQYVAACQGRAVVIDTYASAGKQDIMRIENAGLASHKLLLSTEVPSKSVNIQMTTTLPGFKSSCIFSVAGLVATADGPIEASWEDKGDSILIKNGNLASSYSVTVTMKAKGKTTKSQSEKIKIQPKEVHKISRLLLTKAGNEVVVKAIDAVDSTVLKEKHVKMKNLKVNSG
jgi:hypothetical protein